MKAMSKIKCYTHEWSKSCGAWGTGRRCVILDDIVSARIREDGILGRSIMPDDKTGWTAEEIAEIGGAKVLLDRLILKYHPSDLREIYTTLTHADGSEITIILNGREVIE